MSHAATARPEPRLVRIAAWIVGGLDAAACIYMAAVCFGSHPDPRYIKLDIAIGSLIVALFAISGAPGLALAALRRAPRFALALTLAYPAVFLVAILWL
jgi:hypothetical protein